MIVEALKDDMAKNPVEDRLEEVLNVYQKGSREKRTSRGIVIGAIGGQKAKNIIDRDVICSDRLKKLGVGAESSSEDIVEEDIVRRLSMPARRMRSGTFRRTMERAHNDFDFLRRNGFVSVVKLRKKMLSDQSILE